MSQRSKGGVKRRGARLTDIVKELLAIYTGAVRKLNKILILHNRLEKSLESIVLNVAV